MILYCKTKENLEYKVQYDTTAVRSGHFNGLRISIILLLGVSGKAVPWGQSASVKTTCP